MSHLHRLLIPAIGLALAGCVPDAEPCFYEGASVSITADTVDGMSPLTVELSATASGSACGCCGGRGEGVIEDFRWDLNGDSITDTTGLSVSVTLTEPGLHSVVVTVIDSAGDSAAAVQIITVTDGG